jgi:hypothetical protein
MPPVAACSENHKKQGGMFFMKKKTAILLVAAMLLGLTACGEEKPVEQQQPLPTPEPIVQTQKVTATPTPVVTKDWSKNMAPTFTPTPSPTMTPEEIAAWEAEQAALAAKANKVNVKIDLSTRTSVDGSGLGTDGDDGSVTWTGNDMTKNLLYFGETLPAGKYKVTVKYSFNGTEDNKVRFYFSNESQGNFSSASNTYGFIDYAEGDQGQVKTVVLNMESSEDTTAFMFGGGSYGVSLNNFTLYSVKVQKDNAIKIDMSTRASVDGSGLGTDGENGAVTWTGNDMTKNLLFFGETLPAGKYIVTANYSFNGTEDQKVRFYFSDESQGNFSSASNTYGYIEYAEGDQGQVKTAVMNMESSGDTTAFMFGGGSYGVSLNNFTLYSVSVEPDESITIDMSTRTSVDGSGLGTDGENGAVTWTGNDMTKNLLYFGETLPAGSYAVTVVYSFNGTEDQKVRFYFSDESQGNFSSASNTYGYIEYAEGDMGQVKTVVLNMESSGDTTAFMFGGGSYGVSLNNFTLYSVSIKPE